MRLTPLNSPMGRQRKTESLPYFVLFDGDSTVVKRGADVIEDVVHWKRFKASRREPERRKKAPDSDGPKAIDESGAASEAE